MDPVLSLSSYVMCTSHHLIGPPLNSLWYILITHIKKFSNTFQKSPGLPAPSHIALPAHTMVVKVARECQSLWQWGFLQLPKNKKSFLYCLFLIRQSVADTYYNITSAGPSSDPYLQTLSWFITCPKAKLHVFNYLQTSTNLQRIRREAGWQDTGMTKAADCSNS